MTIIKTKTPFKKKKLGKKDSFKSLRLENPKTKSTGSLVLLSFFLLSCLLFAFNVTFSTHDNEFVMNEYIISLFVEDLSQSAFLLEPIL